jgi:hypothetical protein
MDSALPLVSIVCSIPSDDALTNFHGALFRALRGLESNYRFEIHYASAAKGDGQSSAIDALAQLDPRIQRLSAPTLGSDAVLRAGMAQATGEILLLLDAGVHAADLLPRLLDLAKGPCVWIEGVAQRQPAAKPWQRWLRRGQAPALPALLLLKRPALDALRRPALAQQTVRDALRAAALPRAEFSHAPTNSEADAPAGSLLRQVVNNVRTAWRTSPFTLVVYFGGTVCAIGIFLALWFSLQGAVAPNTIWFSWCYLIVLLHVLCGSILVAVGKLGAVATKILEQLPDRQKPAQTFSVRPAETPAILPLTRPRAAA